MSWDKHPGGSASLQHVPGSLSDQHPNASSNLHVQIDNTLNYGSLPMDPQDRLGSFDLPIAASSPIFHSNSHFSSTPDVLPSDQFHESHVSLNPLLPPSFSTDQNIPHNSHPMLTCSKHGIFKPKPIFFFFKLNLRMLLNRKLTEKLLNITNYVGQWLRNTRLLLNKERGY